MPIKNRPPGESQEPAAQVVSPDALALVRFGLRAADDPRILATVEAIDHLLRVDLPRGPAWHRYSDDGYGEHDDGAPFDGTGVGRAWPLLTGERAHYELARGRPDAAESLRCAFAACAGEGGLLPEQVWDADAIPARDLLPGRPTGSAMPLVWAHAEYVKLLRSLEDGRVFDTPPQTVARYVVAGTGSPHGIWRFNQKCRTIPAGRFLRIEVRAPATVRWTDDGWQTVRESPTRDTGLGIHLVDLDTRRLPPGRTVAFTFRWSEPGRWEGTDFTVGIDRPNEGTP